MSSRSKRRRSSEDVSNSDEHARQPPSEHHAGSASPSSSEEENESEDQGNREKSSPDVFTQAERQSTALDEQPPLPSEPRPPLPSESQPPLPAGRPPGSREDEEGDGWTPIFSPAHGAYYFFNTRTGVSTWDNPRVSSANTRPGNGALASQQQAKEDQEPSGIAGGYNPAIHGDFDPTADYAKSYHAQTAAELDAAEKADEARLTRAAQAETAAASSKAKNDESLIKERFSQGAKSSRQLNAYFDYDSFVKQQEEKAARAQRGNAAQKGGKEKLTKAQLKAYKDRKREKREEKRRAWLRN